MESRDFITFFSVPSLESIAAIKVVDAIFKHTDIRDAVKKPSLEYGFEIPVYRGARFRELDNIIKKKLAFLPIPNVLKDKVNNFKTPLLLQMLNWMSGNRNDIEYMDSVCWSVEGTIDRVKTFEQLVKINSAQQHINVFYELACTCCLEDTIPNLWDRLPEPIQNDYEDKMHREYRYHFIAYWRSIAKNELPGLLGKIKSYDYEHFYDCNKSIFHNMIKLAMSEGNILAVKYFWNKLAAEEINSNLAQWINDSLEKRKHYNTEYQDSNKFSDVLYFLLSQINCPEEQKDIFKKNSEVILTSLFLDWPWQRFLLPTIESIWLSLDEKAYVTLLKTVMDNVRKNETNKRLLRHLWLDSPINLKKYFFQCMISDSGLNRFVIYCFLMAKDMETLKLILNHANDEEKKLIFFSIVNDEQLFIRSVRFYDLFYHQIDFFDPLIDLLSDHYNVHNFKEKIVQEWGSRLCYDCWIHDANWVKAEKFLDWAFTNQDQTDNFKNKTLDKMDITYRLFRREDNYELVEDFLGWCFDSEQEIIQFKKDFAKSNSGCFLENCEDWSDFENFLSWCFTSELDINVFKLTLLEKLSDIVATRIRSRLNFEFVDKLICWCFTSEQDINVFKLTLLEKISDIIRAAIFYIHKFEFVDKLISWCCCHSADQIKEFKAKFVFSDTWLGILDGFVSNRYMYTSLSDSNWELTRKLVKLFSPLDREVIVNLKEKIKSKFHLWTFHPDRNGREISFPIEIKHLFRLIENPCHTISVSDGENSSDDNSNVVDDQG